MQSGTLPTRRQAGAQSRREGCAASGRAPGALLRPPSQPVVAQPGTGRGDDAHHTGGREGGKQGHHQSHSKAQRAQGGGTSRCRGCAPQLAALSGRGAWRPQCRRTRTFPPPLRLGRLTWRARSAEGSSARRARHRPCSCNHEGGAQALAQRSQQQRRVRTGKRRHIGIGARCSWCGPRGQRARHALLNSKREKALREVRGQRAIR